MRKLVDVLTADKDLLAQIETVIYPCIKHTFTEEAIYMTGEGAFMIT